MDRRCVADIRGEYNADASLLLPYISRSFNLLDAGCLNMTHHPCDKMSQLGTKTSLEFDFE
jgi:hypothetical protein